MRVTVLGGTGVFGARLAELLVRDGHAVTVAGRDAAKARKLADRIGATPLCGDLLADPAPVFAARPEVVIDAAGPFQAYGDDPHRLARACIRNGADYLDLSDDAGFTEGIAALDAEARAAGRRVLSGASSVPGLSSAAVAELARGLDEILLIDTAILPGNRAPRGLSVMASILGQVGRPARAWRGGRWRPVRGWTDRRRYAVAPGLARQGWFLEVPDIRLFPSFFGARSVTFRAGLELSVLNAALSALAFARRFAPLPLSAAMLRLAHRVASMSERFGTDRGAMLVSVVGTLGGETVERRWRLVAEAGEGPFVPCVVARALIRRLDRVPPGARPCLAELPLVEVEAAMSDLAVRTDTGETARPTLFRRALGEDWAELPPEIRRLHAVQDVESFSGTATVERGTSALARLAARLFGFPAACEAVPVTVTKTRTERGEIWQRDFGGKVFRSVCTPADAPGRFREGFGPFRFEMDLPVADGAMRLPVRRGWFLGLPLPRALLPTSDSREYVEGGRFRFDVALGAPLGAGLIVRYRGALTPDAGCPEPAEAPCAATGAPLRTAASAPPT